MMRAAETLSRSARSLSAAAEHAPSIDRQHQPWIPLYFEYLRKHQDREGRPGLGLKPGPAILFALLVHRQGTPRDGRRAGRDEAGTNRFVPRSTSAGDFVRDLGFTYDQVQSWGEDLEQPHPCMYCNRGHRLIAIERPPGRRITYRLIRCGDVSAAEAVPLGMLTRKVRKKTGGRGDALAEHPRLDLEVEGAEPSEFFRGFNGGEPPSTAIEKRVLALSAIALLEDVNVPPEIFPTIASVIDSNDVAELRDALLRVVAFAGIQHTTITADFARVVLEPSEKVRHLTAAPPAERIHDPNQTDRWALDRLLDLARRREPQTTHGQGVAYRNELVGRITERCGKDPIAIERELLRLLTDPRVCGTLDKPTPNPIALLRSGLSEGWLWLPFESDDGSGRYLHALKKLPPGAQNEIQRIFESHRAGEPLPTRQLAELGVTSKGMIAYLSSTNAAF